MGSVERAQLVAEADYFLLEGLAALLRPGGARVTGGVCGESGWAGASACTRVVSDGEFMIMLNGLGER